MSSAITVMSQPFVAWKVYSGHQVSKVNSDRQICSKFNESSKGNSSLASYSGKANFSVGLGMHNASAVNVATEYEDGKEILPLLQPFASTLFYVMLPLLVISKVFFMSLAPLLDSFVMNTIKNSKKQTDFGVQRLFGSASFALTSFSAGVAAQNFLHPGLSKYTPVFYISVPFFILLIPFGVILLKQIKCNKEVDDLDNVQSVVQPGVNKLTLLLVTSKEVRNLFFFLTVLIAGTVDRIHMSFLFLLMDDNMNASKTAMGVAVLVACISELFMFPFTGKIIKKLGSPLYCIELGLLVYAVRLLILSYVKNAWASIVVHVLHSITWALQWAGSIECTEIISPKPIRTTLFGLLGGLYFGLPGIIGNMVGGLLYYEYGGPVLFRAASILAFTWFVTMFVCLQVFGFIDPIRSVRDDKVPHEQLLSSSGNGEDIHVGT